MEAGSFQVGPDEDEEVWLLETDEAVVDVVVRAELAEDVELRERELLRWEEPEEEEVWWLLLPLLLRRSVLLASVDLPDFDDCSDDREDFCPAGFMRILRSELLLGPLRLGAGESGLIEGAGEVYSSSKLFT